MQAHGDNQAGAVDVGDGGGPAANEHAQQVVGGAVDGHSDAGDADEPVRTVFLSGLPDDATPREVHLLFVRDPTFEGAVVRSMGGKVVAFATFGSHAAAVAAASEVQGKRFDPNLPQSLRAELAKQTSKVKRQRTDALVLSSHKRLRDSFGGLQFADVHHAQPHPPAPHPLAHFAHAPWQPSPPLLPGFSAQPPYPHMHGELPASSNPPCNTLFVGNLGSGVTEAELYALFSRYHGFVRLKLSPSRQGFAEFRDTQSASVALSALQGVVLGSSENGMVRVEFAKRPMAARTPER